MTTWKRLRTLEAEHSHAAELLAIAEALMRIPQPTEALRVKAATWLERLAGNDKALAAITSTGSGRKAGRKSDFMALDYLVQKELLGKSTAAEASVAKAWGVQGGTVLDAWKDSRRFAQSKLAALTEGRIGESTGRRGETWTRVTLLEAISADLRDAHAPAGRKNSR